MSNNSNLLQIIPNMIDVPTRVRRAIHLNDLVLLKRIIKNNPQHLCNPDFADNGNTSLHLASQLGLLDIVDFLIIAGHEDDGISRNAAWDTPLHLAVEKSEAVAFLLATSFPRCINWKNKQGHTTLMLAARSPHTALIPQLLALSPNFEGSRNPNHLQPSALEATDSSGNTSLHYASAYGQLKGIRTLLEHGADAGARNAWSWTPVSYSASVQAEVYFKGLINSAAAGERERGGDSGGRSRGGSGGRKDPVGEVAASAMRAIEGGRSRGGSGARRDVAGDLFGAGMRSGGGGGVRLVAAESADLVNIEGMRFRTAEDGRRRAGSDE